MQIKISFLKQISGITEWYNVHHSNNNKTDSGTIFFFNKDKKEMFYFI